MTLPPNPPPRPPGRPRDPAKVEAILDASWRLFLERGVEAVTVDTIAAEAGVAKMTLYAYFPDKRALFQEGVRREMAKIETAQALAPTARVDATLRDVLIAFGMGIMTFLASPGAVDFYSALSGELRRDAELARMFYEAGPGRTHANLAAILASPLAGDLHIEDPIRAAELLFGMWQGMTNYRAMLGVDHAEVVADIPERVAEGVDRFIAAHASRLDEIELQNSSRGELVNTVFLHGTVHEARDDLQAALKADPEILALWQNLTPLGRNEFICWVDDAKQATTRRRRIERTRDELLEGKKRPCCFVGCIHRTDKAPSPWQQAVLIDRKQKTGR